MLTKQRLIELIFRDGSRQPELVPLCRKFLERFQPPRSSLICIFDDQERPELSRFGESLRGLSYPTRFPLAASGLSMPFVSAYLHDSQGRKFDFLIYLTHQGCRSPNATVITFAHELRHFMQYGFNNKAFLANKCLDRIRIVKDSKSFPWSLPAEYEAVLTSKKVSEMVLGKDAVLGYAQDCRAGAQQKEDSNESEKWRFFLGLDPEESFDLLEITKLWVNKFRQELIENFPTNNSDEPDFTKDNWWE